VSAVEPASAETASAISEPKKPAEAAPSQQAAHGDAAALPLPGAPTVEPAKTAPAPKPLTALGSSELGFAVQHARMLLKNGKSAEALEVLHARLAAAQNPSSDDKNAVAVTEGRALLEQGKIVEAGLKFEPLALVPANNDIGNDALLRNFWRQAGALSKCRDAELEQVRGGPESWSSEMAAMEQARRIEEKAAGNTEQLESARALYQKAFESGKLDADAAVQCVARLTDLSNRLVLDPKCACKAPVVNFHKVESGDVVEKIAKKYKVNTGQIKRINHLNDKLVVRLGQTLKIIPGDVLYKVDRTHLTGTLYIGGVFIRQYPVGIGPGDATPPGSYAVENKVLNPDWWYDGKKIPFGDPANILGTRWMGFAGGDNSKAAGLGVHGTAFPDSVPGRESKGCVRMHNADVEELYDFMPQGGKVEINE
jgi:LysM repeat protein